MMAFIMIRDWPSVFVTDPSFSRVLIQTSSIVDIVIFSRIRLEFMRKVTIILAADLKVYE